LVPGKKISDPVERNDSLVQYEDTQRGRFDILESISDAFFALDRGWLFTYVNSKAEQFWARTRADLLGKNLWEEFPQVADSEAFREIRRAMDEGVSTSFEAISPDLNAWVYGSAYPSSEGVSVYLQDITERKKAEEALNESEERYRLIVQSALDYAIYTTDLDGRIESWPPGAAAVFGWSAEEAIGQSTAMLFVPEDRASGEPEKELAIAREHGVAPDVRWHLRKDGSHVFIDGMTRPLPDARGLPRGFLKIGQDVTQRRRAETALRESEERLQRTIAIETVGVIFFKADGQITDANDGFLRMGGYSREDLAEGLLRWDVLTPPEWMPRSLQAVEELQKTGRTTPYEKEYIRKDGSRWWGLFAATRLDEEESVEFVVDVSERREAEEERERLVAHELTARAHAEERRRLSRELHDRVAHDMALVHQSLELHEALKDSDPERAEIKMELAKESVKRALHSTKYLSMELRQPEVRRGLEAALADLLRDLVPRNVRVDLSLDGDEASLPPETRNQLFVILREAVRNALNHSGCGEIALELTISPEGVVGRVEDDGRGFEYRKARRGGGIRSMRERAALLNGTLEISAAPKGGTRVTVSVPLEERS
jgi:PAS domain S-box-containing protein